MELLAGVSHSLRDLIELDHDKIALTPGWSVLDQNWDLDTSVCRAAHGRRLRLDAAPRLQSLWGALSFGAAAGTTGGHAAPGSAGDSPPPNGPLRQRPISNSGSRRPATVRNELFLRWRARAASFPRSC